MEKMILRTLNQNVKTILKDKDDLIPKLVEYGLKGIEVYNYKTAKNVKKYKKIAKKYGLVETGGSDYHEGSGLIGEKILPYSIVEELRNSLNRSHL